MPIIGFNFRSIKAVNEEKETKGEVSINSAPSIKNIERKEFDIIKDAVAITFEFKTIYEPKIGEIAFEGEVLYKTDDVKKLLKTWKDSKKIDDSIAVEVLNTIFRRCLTKANVLSDDVRLPPPVRFPTVQKKDEEEK